MANRIPGPHDEQVLPIRTADQEIKASFQDVLDHLRRLTQQVNTHYLIGFRLMAILDAENPGLEAELRRAIDALSNWRKVSEGLTEDEYFALNHANEEARAQVKKDRRRARGKH
jgi:transcriptional regulator of NAD metabolism